MSTKIVGKQKIDYLPKGETERVVGVKLHCVCDTNDEKFEGLRTETYFISGKNPMYDQCAGFPVGAEISVIFNRYGRAESISLCNSRK